MTSTIASTASKETHDTFPINGTDYIEFCVGNAKQSALYYRAAFGFTLAGIAGRRPACAIAPATCWCRTRSASC